MGCSKISALAMVAVVLMTVTTTVAEGQTLTPSCASKLVPCATFLNSSSTERPPASCCDPFREAVTKEMNCLCNLYNTPGLLESVGINITQFLLLPNRCNIPSNLDSCLKDTLRVGQVLSDWECLRSSNDLFRLQFFSLDASSSRYLGIRYIYINNGRHQAKVVWIANPDVPITDSSGNLTITHDGYLMLNNYWGNFSIVNAEQPAMSSNTSATLLDTGNLVLRAGERIVWQSFDHLFDTWLPGMELGMFRLNMGEPQYRFLTSFASPQVPALGAFTLGVDPNNTKQLVIWRRGVPYWRSGTWNGYNFSYFPDTKTYDLFSEFSFRYFSNESQSYFTYTRDTKDSITPWIGMGSSGEIDMGGQLSEDEKSSLHHATDPCAADQAGHWSKGCATPEPSNCKAGNEFIQTNGTMDVWYRSENLSLDISDCKDICTRNCSCNAYASEITDGSRCKFSWGQLQLDNQGEIFYIRKSSLVAKGSQALVPSGSPSTNIDPTHPNHSPSVKQRKMLLWWSIGGAVAFLITLTSGFLLCYLQRRNRHFRGINGRRKDGTSQRAQSLIDELKSKVAIFNKISNGKNDHDLPLFSLSSMEIATDYFSDANEIGKGGFGPVYKGKLVDGQEIAVKRLSRSSRQGLEEFKNEVILISRLQHRNLVKLLGCCIQGDERILIYEYLPNKSLDSFLSDATRRALLDWKKRVHIIEGIAQGLLYLHKYSRLRIIHRDLKTSNILLDNNLNPKISDFGTAKIFGDNESRANTNRIVGTYGYMSPEYALDGLFSVKSDVFSFGVMMLEIISGKMNTGFYQSDRALNLLGCAWDLWKEGRCLEIIDPELVETCSPSEVMRYIQVGFLCVQESAADRPTISEVVSMLSNEMVVISVPKQPAFSIIVSINHANTPEIPKPYSVNGVTISEVEGR